MIRLILIAAFIFLAGRADAETFAMDAHMGYGSFEYEEQDSDTEAESTSDIFVFGVSGEYSLTKDFYLGLNADWGFSGKDAEEWKISGVKVQTNDMKVRVQYYDLRFGYKNNMERLLWKIYISGGWDGQHIEKDAFVVGGVPISFSINEQDLSLWRVGLGTSAQYKAGPWSIDGHFSYAGYFEGKGESSVLPGIDFDAEGNRWDFNCGVSYEIAKNISIRLGVLYSLIDLSKSDIVTGPGWATVFPKIKTRTTAGTFGVNYQF